MKHNILTQKDAQDILSHNRYDGQRPMRKWWINFLSDQIDSGAFIQDTAIHFASVNGGDPVLVDGYHRLNAIANARKPVRVVEIHHRVKDENDLALLYSRLDQGLKRNFSDVADAWNLIEVTGLDNKTQLNQLNAATNMMKTNWNRLSGLSSTRDLEDSVNSVIEWAGPAKAYFSAVHGGELGSLVLKAAIMAVGLVTMRHELSLAHDFWYQVSNSDGIGKDDPRNRLHKWIYDNRTMRGYGGKSIYSNYQMALVSARCWNAFVNNQTLQKLYIPSPDASGNYELELTRFLIPSGYAE